MGAGVRMKLENVLASIGMPTDPQQLPMRPILNDVSVYLGSRAKECFDQGKSPDGKPWLALKHPRNRARDQKAKGGTGQKPLRDKGLLGASVQGQGVHGIREFGANYLEQGTNLDYAGPHNFGAVIRIPEQRRPAGRKPFVFEGLDGKLAFARRIKAHSVRIPQRQFLGITEQDGDRIEQIILYRILGAA